MTQDQPHAGRPMAYVPDSSWRGPVAGESRELL